ncbi:MAG TPA: ImmA/IrrE family metallo-endopeptidase [Streptosporangiaceae bacterium]|nr:ImmA/IrrE family metallo-endopeptidase [Streptosporangiaceae bacterium]
MPTRAGQWPTSPAEVRKALGSDFVRPFVDRLEECLGIDVVRVQELSTAYSLTIGGWAVIAIPATGNWFRENWDLGHELDHLVGGHHDEGISKAKADRHEADANAFAAELLLPAHDLHGVNWDAVSDAELARRVWEWGVSTDALCHRLKALDGQVPAAVAQWAAKPTQRLLRLHLAADNDYRIDKITERMDQAAQRRFPLHLQEAHLKRIAAGAISSATLAWMLGIDPSMLEVDSPEAPEVDADDLAVALGL